MKSSWYKNRLASTKRGSLLYSSLSDIVQSLVSSFVEPWLNRITNRKSIFSMDARDLETRTNELGQFFTIRTENSSSVPMLLQQRLDEIHFKGTERPINQTIYREFEGIRVSWEPIYAPVNMEKYPYGTVFITEGTLDSAKLIYGDMFLTSRGMLSIPVNDLGRSLGIEGVVTDQEAVTEAVLTKFNQFVKPLLPLHIVFDGLSLYLDVEIDECAEELVLFSVVDADKSFFWTDCGESVVFDASSVVLDTIVVEPGPMVEFTPTTFDRTRADALILDSDRPL